ncbi:MAG: SMI1/KNR4 family protein [Roseovarius sp.]
MGTFSAINSVVAVPARIVFSIVLLAFPFLAGMAAATPWYIAACVPVFVMSDVIGKWRLQFAGKPGSILARFVATALIAQTCVVGVIYLLGRGLGSLTGQVEALSFGEAVNLPLVAVYAAIMVALGLVLLVVEREKMSMQEMVSTEIEVAQQNILAADHDYDGLNLPAARIDPAHFFTKHHYSHYDQAPGSPDKELNHDLAFADAARIDAVETTLNVRLPDMLRALYLMQNGGSVRNVFVGDPETPRIEDIGPFSGYEELYPLENLRSLHDAVGDYAYEEDAEMFPREAKRMIVLAQWYRATLFLDYRDGRDAPRVGFYDFDRSRDLSDDAWEQDATFWPDFESFMASLYRQDRSGQ